VSKSLIDVIFARRSIHRYTTEPVDEQDIRTLLEAAMAAPSASNLKPWHFVVVTERKMLDALAEVHPHGKMLFEATLCVAGHRRGHRSAQPAVHRPSGRAEGAANAVRRDARASRALVAPAGKPWVAPSSLSGRRCSGARRVPGQGRHLQGHAQYDRGDLPGADGAAGY
jgi:nitroreductase